MREYSEKYKSKLVQRMLLPGGLSAKALAAETGICQPTLSRWRREAANVDVVKTKRRKRTSATGAFEQRRPEDRSAEEKLRLVVEARAIPDAELGEFLRRHGLHEADLNAWREMALAALGAPPVMQARRPVVTDTRRVRELEKELLRKDRALAETAALLVLKKKVQAIWGDEDDDTTSESDE